MTTQQAAPPQQRYLEAFEALESTRAAQQPTWLRELKKEAIGRFAHLGFPTGRRGNEEWKYTDVRPIAEACPLPISTASALGLDGVTVPAGSLDFPQRLVFVDGVYNESRSSVSGLPEGVTVCGLGEALTQESQLAHQNLAQHADFQGSAFTALNTAFLGEGAYLHVPDGMAVTEPLLLLFLTTGQHSDALVQPRILLVTGRHAEIKVVQSFEGPMEGRHLTNSVTEVVVGDGASVQLYRVQRESIDAFHVHTTEVEMGRDSSFSSVGLDLGGAIVRNNLNVQLSGLGASCMLNGLYLASGRQHVDNQVLVDHKVSHTTTRQLYKGILDGSSRTAFHGGITVRPDAQKVDAQQQDRNLLLSDRAEADAKPAFWIYADDVKCAHGATCGKLDESAIFYLRSRGLDEREARTILTQAFANEVVSTIPNEPLRETLEGLVLSRLQQMDSGEE
jgi:Fe-S cluster assembly protein SufD